MGGCAGWGGFLWSREEVEGGTALSPEKPVESQMPLYPWPHCAFASESLSSISLIRGGGGGGWGQRQKSRGKEAGKGRGVLPGQPLIALMSRLPCWLLSFGPRC